MPNPTPDDKRKFMALVKAAFANHIIDLANSKTGCPETAVSQVAMNDATTTLADLLPVQHEESTFRTLLASAPKEVTRLVELIMKGEARVGMTNKYYCRKLGLNPNMNLPELIRQHFCMM
jgi:hypothetical protein